MLRKALFSLGVLLALSAGAFALWAPMPAIPATNPVSQTLYVPANDTTIRQIKVYSYSSGSYSAATPINLGAGEACYAAAVNPAGNKLFLSISSGSSSKLRIYNLTSAGLQTGTPTDVAWTSDSASAPTGLALSADGNTVYVADGGSAKIRVISYNGSSWSQTATINSKNNIYGIALSEGKLYVTTKLAAGELLVYSASTRALLATKTGLNLPTQVQAHNGKIFVAVNGNDGNDLRVYNQSNNAFIGNIKSGYTYGNDWKGFDVLSTGWLIFKKAPNAASSYLFKVNTSSISGDITATKIGGTFTTAEGLAVSPDNKALVLTYSKNGTFQTLNNSSGTYAPINTTPTIAYTDLVQKNSSNEVIAAGGKTNQDKLVKFYVKANDPDFQASLNLTLTYRKLGGSWVTLTKNGQTPGSTVEFTPNALVTGEYEWRASVSDGTVSSVNTYYNNNQNAVDLIVVSQEAEPTIPNLHDPSAFNILEPLTGAVTDNKPTLKWEKSTDADGDTVRYWFTIYKKGTSPLSPITYEAGLTREAFTLKEALAPGEYSFSISAYDSYNNFTGASNNPQHFTVVADNGTAPQVTVLDPVDESTHVPLNKNIVITFSEPMQNALLWPSPYLNISLTPEWNADRTVATFTHEAFVAGQSYQMGIIAQDMYDNWVDFGNGILGADGKYIFTAAPVLNSITVTPANQTIASGEALQYTATGNYADGSSKNLAGAAYWTSSKTSVATIDSSSGLATAVGAGSAVIRATADGITGTTNLTVTPPVVGSLTLTYPLGGEVIKGGVNNITWNYSGIPDSANLKVEYTTNNGSSWVTATTATPINTGSYPLNLPTNTSTPMLKVRITYVAGNVASTSGQLTLDNAGPQFLGTIAGPSSPTYETTLSFGWSATTATDTYSALGNYYYLISPVNNLTAAQVLASGTETSGQTATFDNVAYGRHYFYVIILDSLGNPSNPLRTSAIDVVFPNITLVSPETAAMFENVTLTGTNFGSVKQQILVNGLDIPAGKISSWTNTKVQFSLQTDAGYLAAGPATVQVKVDNSLSAPAAFTIRPTVYGVEPSSGQAGSSIFIRGNAFGDNSANISVSIGGVNVPVSGSVDHVVDGDQVYDQVSIAVPALAPGQYPVVITINGEESTDPIMFTVLGLPVPTISNIYKQGTTSETTYVYDTIEILGSNFGSIGAGSSEAPAGASLKIQYEFGTELLTVPAANIFWWEENKIVALVAFKTGAVYANAGSTLVQVENSNGSSNTRKFRIDPRIYDLTPKSGSAGTTLQIKGTGFRQTAADNTVKFDSERVDAASLTNSISDQTLTVLVPTVSAGEKAVLVETSSIDSNSDYALGNSDPIIFTVTDPSSVLVSIAVTPVNPSVFVGNTLQFTATGTYADGHSADLSAVATWNSSNTSVATINGSGLASALVVGSTNITATLSGITSAVQTLTVTEGISEITIKDSASTDIYIYDTIDIKGEGFGGGSGANSAPADSSITLNTAGGTVTLTGPNLFWWQDDKIQVLVPFQVDGVYTVAGPVTVTVTTPNGSATGSLTIRPKVYSITPVEGPVGSAVAITGTGFAPNAADNTIAFGADTANGATHTYNADNSSLQVTVPATSTGEKAVLVTVNGAISNANYDWAPFGPVVFTVTDPSSVLVSIAVTPVNPSVFVGNTLQFTATGTYADGHSADLSAVATWNSSNTSVATINSAGLASALVVGSTNITATLSGITSAVQPLTVKQGVSEITIKDSTSTDIYIYDTIDIKGEGFGGGSGANSAPADSSITLTTAGGTVTLNGSNLFWWQDDKIQVLVPFQVDGVYTVAGPVTVTVTTPNGSATGSLTIRPKVYSITPVEGPVGTAVAITGTGFAPNAADNTIAFGADTANGTTHTYNADNSSLQVAVPATSTGEKAVLVTVNGALSNANYDWAPFGPVVFTVTSGTITISNLNIVRDGDAAGSSVTVSWQTDPVNSPVDVYAKSGAFSTDPAEWTLLAGGVTINTQTDANQVGNGIAKYYKVVQGGKTLVSDDLKADVVGKFDVLLKGNGFTLISLPLITGNNALTSVIGNQLTAGWDPSSAGTVYSNNDGSWNIAWKDQSSGNWLDPNWQASTVTVDPDSAYWIFDPIEHNISIVGRISNEPRSRQLNVGWNFIGSSYPLATSVSNSGFSGSTAGWDPSSAGAVYSDNNGSWDIAWKDQASGNWLDTNWQISALNLEPGKGYWLYEPNNPYLWNYPKPY